MEFTDVIKADSYILSRALQIIGQKWHALSFAVVDGDKILWQTYLHPKELQDSATSDAVIRGTTEDHDIELHNWARPTDQSIQGVPTVLVDASNGNVRIGFLSHNDASYEPPA